MASQAASMSLRYAFCSAGSSFRAAEGTNRSIPNPFPARNGGETALFKILCAKSVIPSHNTVAAAKLASHFYVSSRICSALSRDRQSPTDLGDYSASKDRQSRTELEDSSASTDRQSQTDLGDSSASKDRQSQTELGDSSTSTDRQRQTDLGDSSASKDRQSQTELGDSSTSTDRQSQTDLGDSSASKDWQSQTELGDSSTSTDRQSQTDLGDSSTSTDRQSQTDLGDSSASKDRQSQTELGDSSTSTDRQSQTDLGDSSPSTDRQSRTELGVSSTSTDRQSQMERGDSLDTSIDRQREMEPENAFDGIAPQASPSSSTAMKKGPYDVFINHRGCDVKYKLASSIYHTLGLLGLRPFLDVKELELGDPILDEIQNAMRTAAIHIAIFSVNYAHSPWCLAELSYMLKTGTRIIPVFYHVKPDDLRWVAEGKGVYAPAFSHHEKKGRYSADQLEEWKTALQRVSYLSGYTLNSDNEGSTLKL